MASGPQSLTLSISISGHDQTTQQRNLIIDALRRNENQIFEYHRNIYWTCSHSEFCSLTQKSVEARRRSLAFPLIKVLPLIPANGGESTDVLVGDGQIALATVHKTKLIKNEKRLLRKLVCLSGTQGVATSSPAQRRRRNSVASQGDGVVFIKNCYATP